MAESNAVSAEFSFSQTGKRLLHYQQHLFQMNKRRKYGEMFKVLWQCERRRDRPTGCLNVSVFSTIDNLPSMHNGDLWRCHNSMWTLFVLHMSSEHHFNCYMMCTFSCVQNWHYWHHTSPFLGVILLQLTIRICQFLFLYVWQYCQQCDGFIFRIFSAYFSDNWRITICQFLFV